MPFPAKDRWERKLEKRGLKHKRSARYTKKGDRPRSATKSQPVEKAAEALKKFGEAENDMGAAFREQAVKLISNPYVPPGQIHFYSNDQHVGTTSSVTVSAECPYEPIDTGTDATTTFIRSPITYTFNVETASGIAAYQTDWVNQTNSGTIETGPLYQTRYQPTNDFWYDGAADTPVQPLIADGDFLTIENNQWILSGQARSKADLKREKIKRQLQARALNHHGLAARATQPSADFTTVNPTELVALRLLKGMVDKDQWRRYLRYGFVLARGKSGMIYQIIRGQAHVKVYRRGDKVAELCIKVPGVPPTDEVIARKVMIECDEMRIWHDANIHGNPMGRHHKPTEQELFQLAAA